MKQDQVTPVGRLSLTRAADQKEGRGAEREDKGEEEEGTGPWAGSGPGYRPGHGSAERGVSKGRVRDAGPGAGAAEEGRRFPVRPPRFAPSVVPESAEPGEPFLQPRGKPSEVTNRGFRECHASRSAANEIQRRSSRSRQASQRAN